MDFVITKILRTIGLAGTAAAIALTPPAEAAVLNVMPLGDSIASGEGSTDGNGWRGRIQELLNTTSTDYDIVGTLQDGTPDIDRDHFGIPGILAYGFGNVNTGLREQLDVNNVFPTLQTAGHAPDKVLLHIGTNRISDLGSGDLAGTELDFLLRGLTTTDPASSHYIGAEGNHEIVLAYIIPKTGSPTQPNPIGGVYGDLTSHRARVKASFDYNYGGLSNLQWADGLATVATHRTQYIGRVRLVDMFRIDINSLNLNVLLIKFGESLGVTTTDEIRDLLSPDDDRLNGNSADWIDWVLNYDEVNNTFGTGTDGRNLALYASGDFIHPSDFGYAIMAQVWFTQGLGLILSDVDGDGFVSILDLNAVLANWNQPVTPGDAINGDLNKDGLVDILDLNLVLANWNAGTPPPSSGQAPTAIVPEPASLTIGLILSLASVRRARPRPKNQALSAGPCLDRAGT